MKQINSYINELFAEEDTLLKDVLKSIGEKGMRQISVSPASGKMLTMLVSMSKSEKLLEIGALGG